MNPQSKTSTKSNVLRVETLATRITSVEMRALRKAATESGLSCSEWLREAALAYLQETDQKSTTPIEMTILEEIMGFRLLMVNLFAGVTPGVALQTVHHLMAHANSVKHEAAEAVRCQVSK